MSCCPNGKRRALRASAKRRHRKKCPWTSRDECSTARERRTGVALACGARHGRRKKNPLTRLEVLNLVRRARSHRRHGRALFRSSPKYSIYHKGLGDGLLEAMRTVGVRGKKKKKNPLLQVVLPNRSRRRNPLTKREVASLRKWAGKVARDTRRVRGHKATWLGVSSGLLSAACDFGKAIGDPKRWTAYRSSSKMLGRSMRVKRNPLVRGRRPGVRGAQRITVGGFVSKQVASTYPGFRQALEIHRKFHGREPVHFTRIRLEDGQPHVTRKAVVMIGDAPAIEYRTWRHADSKKSFTKDGRRITWRHKMGEDGGRPAYYVHDPLSGVTSLLGGTYRIAGRPAFYHN